MSFFSSVSKHCRSYTEAHDQDMPVSDRRAGTIFEPPVRARDKGQWYGERPAARQVMR